MKKLGSILLLFIFVFSTLGLSFVVNYCPMKQGYSISLQAHKSCCCDDETENDCCKSEKVTLHKIEDKYTAVSFHFSNPQFEYVAVLAPQISIDYNAFVNPINRIKEHKPPKVPVSRNILYQTFLI